METLHMKPHKFLTFLVVLFLAACGTIEVGIEHMPTSAESATVNAHATDEAYLDAQPTANIPTATLSALSIETPVGKVIPSLTPPILGSTDMGELFFSIQTPDRSSTKHLKVSGACALGLSSCTAPEVVNGYPNNEMGMEPLFWSPLGDTAALFTYLSDNMTGQVMLFTPALNEWRPLNQYQSPVGGVFQPWSEDGKWIAVMGNIDPYEISVISAETGEKREISGGIFGQQNGWIDSLSWFSGQVLVAFHNQAPGSVPGGLWLIPPSGGGPVQMAAFDQPFRSPEIAPSGKAIAVVLDEYYPDRTPSQNQSPDRSRVILTNLYGKPLTTLAEFKNNSVTDLRWSWNGKWILFSIYNIPDGGYITYAIRPDGSNLHEVIRLTQATYNILPTPDDDTFLIQTAEFPYDRIYRVSVTTGNHVVLEIPGIGSNMDWEAASWQLPRK
jgi:hypothetical protein